MSDFLARFSFIKSEALATEDGMAFTAAGFDLWPAGGGCTAWRKNLPDGKYLLITGMDGSDHVRLDDEEWLIGLHSDDGCFGWREAVTTEAAIAAATALTL
ncbi:hypothetical protein [Shinella zoogloeoides]|uniref:hypothetical protein n=1 Tax=Shinella zoogloeoides TaxID=352475 RepID=UPI00299F216B|nr:hypothetical protein [Shinella zoogloeoides]WPE19918.1 hypothetical protein ShzoTeo12_10940 [Shinella zoogloeoides]